MSGSGAFGCSGALTGSGALAASGALTGSGAFAVCPKEKPAKGCAFGGAGAGVVVEAELDDVPKLGKEGVAAGADGAGDGFDADAGAPNVNGDEAGLPKGSGADGASCLNIDDWVVPG